MHIEGLRDFALSLPDVEESCPFGPDNLVMKTNGSIFLIISLDAEVLQFNVKCDPDKAISLRDEYPNSVLPGYHMNKKHWNTIVSNGELSEQQVREFVLDSHTLISQKKKASRASLKK